MLILKTVLPKNYDKATVLGGYTDDGLQRISMVLEGERKKLNMG